MQDFIFDVILYNPVQLTFQITASAWVFWKSLEKRSCFAWRLAAGIFLQLLLSVGWFLIVGPFEANSRISSMILYIGYSILAAVPTWLAYDASINEIIFVIGGAYSIQHISFSLSKISMYFLGLDYHNTTKFLLFLITRYIFFAAVSGLLYLLIFSKIQISGDYKNGDVRIAALSALVAIVAIVISVIWSYDESLFNTIVGEVVCPLYGLMSCVIILWMCFQIFAENKAKEERKVMEQMLVMADAQQKSTSRAIDIINIKVHDLKHQIKALEDMDDSDERRMYLEEIREATSIYDAQFQTGNKALDYVLREKSLVMDENKVDFDCIAEGELLSFLSAADVYALAGNTLDNAIEAVLKEKEEERFITLQIRRKAAMTLFHAENRCSQAVVFTDGLPATSKEDKLTHGFGTRSIRYIAEKYDGHVRMKCESGVFSVDVLFPH